MIDIHNHLLYGIDDGAEDVDVSIKMCIDAVNNKTRTIVCTPHFYKYDQLEDFLEIRDRRIERLRNILKDEDVPLKLLSGAELFLSDEVFDAENLDSLTIQGTNYMLCEFPLGPFNVEKAPLWIDELIDRGYRPILAHPERYVELHRNFNIIDELLRRNVVFQVNIDSLAGKNGAKPQGMAIDMIARKIAKLIATDAHDPEFRHTRILQKLNEIPSIIDEDLLEECLEINPERILRNKKI